MTIEEVMHVMRRIVREEVQKIVREEVHAAICVSEQRTFHYIQEVITPLTAQLDRVNTHLNRLHMSVVALNTRLQGLEAIEAVATERLSALENEQKQVQSYVISLRDDLVNMIEILDEATKIINDLRNSQWASLQPVA